MILLTLKVLIRRILLPANQREARSPLSPLTKLLSTALCAIIIPCCLVDIGWQRHLRAPKPDCYLSPGMSCCAFSLSLARWDCLTMPSLSHSVHNMAVLFLIPALSWSLSLPPSSCLFSHLFGFQCSALFKCSMCVNVVIDALTLQLWDMYISLYIQCLRCS